MIFVDRVEGNRRVSGGLYTTRFRKQAASINISLKSVLESVTYLH